MLIVKMENPTDWWSHIAESMRGQTRRHRAEVSPSVSNALCRRPSRRPTVRAYCFRLCEGIPATAAIITPAAISASSRTMPVRHRPGAPQRVCVRSGGVSLLAPARHEPHHRPANENEGGGHNKQGSNIVCRRQCSAPHASCNSRCKVRTRLKERPAAAPPPATGR
jgi:hypothetical protein